MAAFRMCSVRKQNSETYAQYLHAHCGIPLGS
ncbi:hypothetical protein SAMN05444172_1444 [Burkholderia sp. GAS332]|jgi:hypothetical protein|nr:hypothetical protein SAMN05444172_1444 [Burkholderia sp. GAS332]